LHPIFPATRCLLLLIGCVHGASAYAAASLRAVSIAAGADSTTLEMRLSAPVTPRGFTLRNPHRLVIDLPSTRQALRQPLPRAVAPIRSLRIATRVDGSVRVVMEFTAGTTAELAPLTTTASGESLVRIATRVTGASVAHATAPVAPAHAPDGSDRNIVIAVDAGHGGEDPGASGRDGTREKQVTLAIARALAERINGTPGMRAVLTRSSDVFVPLRDRAGRARSARADLFVSIHADAVRDRDVEGASVYVLSERGASSEAARFLADRENSADLKGVSLAGRSESLASVLVDLSQSAAMGSSVEAASVVLSALDQVGAVRKKQVQHAGFVVLKSPDMPSMLVETAYISNPGEERKLRSTAYQRQLAAAISDGIAGYFRDHPPDGTRYASERHRGAGSAVTLARSRP
jgi:N-acetylmuramoyl-L-alanine amidase